MRMSGILLKSLLGIALSAAFLYLAFHSLDRQAFLNALGTADYRYVASALVMTFLIYYVRAFRWHYFLAPLREIPMGTLFPALIIGLSANTILPAHLGEFARAYAVGKKEPIASSAVFGTIVVERIIDVLAVIVLIALTLFVSPLPEYLLKSSYLMLGGIGGLSFILIIMKKMKHGTDAALQRLLSFFPPPLASKLGNLFAAFLDGFTPLKKRNHYLIVVALSIMIWVVSLVMVEFVIEAFNLRELYALPWYSSLVVLIFICISVAVPSSPGYIGTFHYLCQLALGLFGVPREQALTYAIILHAINTVPVMVLGLIFLSSQKLSLRSIYSDSR